MKSKTKIEKQVRRKRNPILVETIDIARKNDMWLEVASLLTRPKRKQINVNLDKIEENTGEGDTIVVPGKVLSSGNLSKKVRIASMSFSEKARKKLEKAGCEIVQIKQEIEKNPKAEGVKIIY